MSWKITGKLYEHFPGLSRTYKQNARTFKDFPGQQKKSRTFQDFSRMWQPWFTVSLFTVSLSQSVDLARHQLHFSRKSFLVWAKRALKQDEIHCLQAFFTTLAGCILGYFPSLRICFKWDVSMNQCFVSISNFYNKQQCSLQANFCQRISD